MRMRDTPRQSKRKAILAQAISRPEKGFLAKRRISANHSKGCQNQKNHAQQTHRKDEKGRDVRAIASQRCQSFRETIILRRRMQHMQASAAGSRARNRMCTVSRVRETVVYTEGVKEGLPCMHWRAKEGLLWAHKGKARFFVRRRWAKRV